MALNYNYTPFFKFKTNEVAALSVLNSNIKEELTPFFDFARKDGMDRSDFEKTVTACAKKAFKYLKDFPYIFIDSFDIPDSITTTNDPNCQAIIKEFSKFLYIPVVGLDRAPNHNKTIFDAKAKGEILSDKVAIRFQPEEFSSFELVENELLDLIKEGSKVFSSWILIFDCRVCLESNRLKLATEIANFALSADDGIEVEKYIVVGSSIPASITDIAKPSDESVISRAELEIFHAAQSLARGITLSLGDYTIVSPLYSDLTIAPELLLSVTAPKVFYTYENQNYIARGGRIKTGGYGQYDLICQEITQKSFYRKYHYSWGDNFIQERADGKGTNNITPSTILKPTICAHIEYMSRDYPS